MKRGLSLLFAVLASLAVPTTAHAASTVPLGAGSTVVIQQASGASPGQCALAAVGTDAQGRTLGLTAGHCAVVGDRILTADRRTVVGTVVTSKRFPGDGVFVFDALDYAFIEFTDVVRPARTTPVAISGVGRPTVGEVVCKYGAGDVDPGERCGVVDRTAPREFSALLFGSFGDSGGPVHAGGQLIGILSRPSGIPYVSGVISTRADAAIADAARTGAIGGTFRPLA
ncbi:S1 family peptidase [Williamsia serinedens]|uniref:Trypsin-like peptidase n=1 Tax=Williamsia serinedens TaxID=391736 RepID=A0ABT1H533_9NOCA|nr:S1 family peptidase [Williamsia serinedens]MCP2161847.1 hypothetical protein [Williamsia serinedens]